MKSSEVTTSARKPPNLYLQASSVHEALTPPSATALIRHRHRCTCEHMHAHTHTQTCEHTVHTHVSSGPKAPLTTSDDPVVISQLLTPDPLGSLAGSRTAESLAQTLPRGLGRAPQHLDLRRWPPGLGEASLWSEATQLVVISQGSLGKGMCPKSRAGSLRKGT